MGEIVSGVNVITEYNTPQDNKVYGGFIDYLNKEQAKQIEYQDYNDYIAKTKSIFTNEKDDLSPSEISSLKEIFETAQNNGSFMWKTVISFDNRWLEKYGVYDMKSKTLNEPKIREVVRCGINKMLENEGLGNAVWSAGIHYDTDNIHVHVATVEPIPMREKKMFKQYNIGRDDKNRLTYKEPILDQSGEQVTLEEYVGKFKQKSIKLCKSTVANGIMEQKDINLQINQIIRDQIVKDKKNIALRIDPKLQDMFFSLYDTLPDCNINMWKYDQNIMKPYREQIDQLTDRFLDIYHKNDMKRLNKLLKIQSANYAMAYGNTDQDYRKNKRKDLYYRMGNAILQEMREYHKELKDGISRKNIPIPDIGIDKVAEEINAVSEFDVKEGEAATVEEPVTAGEPVTAREPVTINEPVSATQGTLSEQSVPGMQEPQETQESQEFQIQHGKAAANGTAESEKDEQLYSKWTSEYVSARSTFYGSLEKNPNHTAGFNMYIDECYNGNVLAAYDIGRIYEYGIGREADKDQADKYYVRAFEGWKTLLDQVENQGPVIKIRGRGGKITYRDPDIDKSNYNYKLAKCYDMGTGTEQNFELAYQHYVSAESLGNIYAAYSLGDMYYFGKGKEIDKSIAYQHYCKGVSTKTLKNPYCDYRVANMMYRGEACPKNIDGAQRFYSQALDGFISFDDKTRDDKLEYRIGCMFKDGLGCDIDYEKAFQYFSKSAENNNSYAEYALGKMYLLGEGIEKKPELAMKWLHKSADQENEWAQYALGKIYLEGEIVERNPELAMEWLHKSADQDNQCAEYALGKIYLEGEIVERNPELAIKWLEKSADQDNEWAQYALGKIYLEGEIVERDPELAIKWLEKSADQDNQYAGYALGKIYMEGEITEKNPELAIKWLEKSADQENQWAQYTLGKIYMEGEIVERDPELAIKWLEKSADQENQWAQYSLGRIYMDGKDVKQDMEKAMGYFINSAKQENSYAQYYLGKICLKNGNYNMAGMWLGKAIQNNNVAAVNLYTNQMQKFGSNKAPTGLFLAKLDLNKSLNEFVKSMNNNYESWKNMIEYERMEQQRLQQNIYQDKGMKDIDLE